MDRYINVLFRNISLKYKITILMIMSYNNKTKNAYKTYKLTIDKKNKSSKIPKSKIVLTYYNKKDLIMEMIKWT